MLLGIGLKNYKVYKNVQYIPISLGASFSAYLGPNGIGKTSIFEALDVFLMVAIGSSTMRSRRPLMIWLMFPHYF